MPDPIRESLVGAAVLELPDDVRDTATREFQTWLVGLRTLPARLVPGVADGEALLREEANDPGQTLYAAAAQTLRLHNEVIALSNHITKETP